MNYELSLLKNVRIYLVFNIFLLELTDLNILIQKIFRF